MALQKGPEKEPEKFAFSPEKEPEKSTENPTISPEKLQKLPENFDEKLSDVMRTALKRETGKSPESPELLKPQFLELKPVNELISSKGSEFKDKLNSPNKNLSNIAFAELVASYQKKYLTTAGLLDDLANLWGTTVPQAVSRGVRAVDYTLGRHIAAKKDVLRDPDTLNEYNNKQIKDLQLDFKKFRGGAPFDTYYYEQATEVYTKVREVFNIAYSNRPFADIKTKEYVLGNSYQSGIYMLRPSTPDQQVKLLMEDERLKVNPPKIRELVERIMEWYDIDKFTNPRLSLKQLRKLNEEIEADMREEFEKIKVEIINNVHLQRHDKTRWITFNWDPGEVFEEN